MSEQNKTDEQPDAFAILVERTKKVLKKHPNMSVGDFVNGYLFSLLDEVRTETNEAREAVEELWDYIGEIPDEPLLDEIEQTFLALAGFLDLVLIRAGWLGATGPNDSFPADMREQFVVLGKKLAEVQDRIGEVRSLATSGEDDEDEDEEAEADEEAAAAEVKTEAPVTEAKALTPSTPAEA